MGTIYDAWLARAGGDTLGLRLENLGGGSDFSPFSHNIGVPSGTLALGGPSGVYHSMYDSYEWMTRFGDPGYREHRAVSQLVTIALSRLANADIMPFDYQAFGMEMMSLAAQIDVGIAARRWNISTTALWQALVDFTYAGEAFNIARDSALAVGVDPARTAQANRWLMQVERRLTRIAGPRGASVVSQPAVRVRHRQRLLDDGVSFGLGGDPVLRTRRPPTARWATSWATSIWPATPWNTPPPRCASEQRRAATRWRVIRLSGGWG